MNDAKVARSNPPQPGSVLPNHPQRKTAAWLLVTSVILIDGSYLLVMALDEGARLTFGSNLVFLLFVTPLPAFLSLLICLGMTGGSARSASAGATAAWVITIAALLFAALKISGIGSYGNEMDGAVVVVEVLVTSVVAFIVLVIAAVAASRDRRRDHPPR